ncbi:hypothetical protein Hanom_Chr08g00748431 [Helianthus anomalus]
MHSDYYNKPLQAKRLQQREAWTKDFGCVKAHSWVWARFSESLNDRLLSLMEIEDKGGRGRLLTLLFEPVLFLDG